jgi:hypothetical protein
MDEQRKYAILFAATIPAARKLNEIGVRPCPARECAIADAITNAVHILEKIDERWPTRKEDYTRRIWRPLFVLDLPGMEVPR